MSSSDSEAPEAPDNEAPSSDAHDEAQAAAQRAADELRGQIAAVRAQVRTAQDRLRGDPARRAKEPRSFED